MLTTRERAKQIAGDLGLAGTETELNYLDASLRLTKDEGIAVGLRQAGSIFLPLQRSAA